MHSTTVRESRQAPSGGEIFVPGWPYDSTPFRLRPLKLRWQSGRYCFRYKSAKRDDRVWKKNYSIMCQSKLLMHDIIIIYRGCRTVFFSRPCMPSPSRYILWFIFEHWPLICSLVSPVTRNRVGDGTLATQNDRISATSWAHKWIYCYWLLLLLSKC